MLCSTVNIVIMTAIELTCCLPVI